MQFSEKRELKNKTVFTERLRECIQMRELSSRQIADGMYCSMATVYNYCEGRSQPNMESLRLLCQVLDVSADYLLGLVDVDYVHKSKHAK